MARSVVEVIADAKRLAVEYRLLTGKPLGISGEVAEIEVHRCLGLELAPARTAGHDAIRHLGEQSELVQVKGRAIDIAHPRKGRLPSINLAHPFDSVVLVLIDQATMNPYEIWEVRRDRVESLLTKPGSKARNERGALAISQFCAHALRVWRSVESEAAEEVKRARIEARLSKRSTLRSDVSSTTVAFTPERRERWKQVTRDGPFNLWLNPQVTGADGSLDLERLYRVAREWGVNERYEHLNPGMIRMNIGNRLRAIVPVKVYERRNEA
jgi:hypothetical protein